jgi:hypothetical protein
VPLPETLAERLGVSVGDTVDDKETVPHVVVDADGVSEPVGEPLALSVGDALLQTDSEVVPLLLTLEEILGDSVGDTLDDKESVTQVVADNDGDSEPVGETLTLSVGDALPQAD